MSYTQERGRNDPEYCTVLHTVRTTVLIHNYTPPGQHRNELEANEDEMNLPFCLLNIRPLW